MFNLSQEQLQLNKYPAEISGNTVTILPLQTSDENFILVTSITPPSAELGRSSGIDMPVALKTKLNNIQTITLESGSTPAMKYPVDLSGNTITILPLQSSDDNFILVNHIPSPSTGIARSIGFDLKDTVKTKLDNIQTVQLETGATPAKKYPAEISGNTVNILPLQSGDSNYITVTSITPPSAELGRSIDIDLSESAKSVIYNAHNYAKTNEDNDFWNINTFKANTTVQADLTVTGNIINTSLTTSLTNLTNQVTSFSQTKFFTYPNYVGEARYYKLGRLNLPIDGHQAVITINLCYGFNATNHGVNFSGYNIQNYEMKIHLYSSTSWSSRSVFPGSLGNDPSRYNDPNNSIYHNGFVVTTSPFVNPLGVFLAPVPSDPQNNVDIWFRSYMWHGRPLIQVTQTAGSFTATTDVNQQNMPRDCYIQLDMYSNTLTQIYRNLYNV